MGLEKKKSNIYSAAAAAELKGNIKIYRATELVWGILSSTPLDQGSQLQCS